MWPRVVTELQPNQRAWLRTSEPVTVHESTAIVAVPNDFTRGQVEGRLRGQLEDALSEAFGREIRIAVTVNPALDDHAPAAYQTSTKPTSPQVSLSTMSPSTAAASGRITRPQVWPAANEPERLRPALETRLNPKYTFETFVIGSSNRFPHAAAVAVSEAPGKAYNPLLVYGDSGLGKTHLLHAIGHYVRSLYTGAQVRYVSSEEFTNEFINAIRDDRQDRFKRRYRDVDVLLIDDIQFLEGKTQTQEEFFHTFNTLHNANKQIVLTSDRAPKRLEALEDRLRNRFEWGLITDVQPPDLETRIAILRKKAAMDRLSAPADVLEFIASKIQTNIRELEGALIRVTAFANLNRQEVDLTLAEIVLKDLIPEGGEPGDHRGADHRPDGGLLRDLDRGPHRPLARPAPGDGPADRDVPVPRAHSPVAAQDRRAVRQPRPHHGHVRRSQDQPAPRRAARRVQPGLRAHQPDQDPGPPGLSRPRLWTTGGEPRRFVHSPVGRRPAAASRRARFHIPRSTVPSFLHRPCAPDHGADLRRRGSSTGSTDAMTTSHLYLSRSLVNVDCASTWG